MKNYTGLWGGLAFAVAVFSSGAWAQAEIAEEAAADADAPSDEGGDASELANANDRRLYVSPMFTYTASDDDRATDNGIGGTISVGKKMTSGLNLELTGFYQKMDPEAGAADAAELTGVGIGAMIFPSVTWPRVYGIVAVHQGQTDNHPTTPASTDFSYKSTVFDTGIGYVFGLRDYLGGFDMALRAEARYRMDSHHKPASGNGGKDEFYEAVFNLGVLMPLGDLPSEAAPPAEAAPGDADGDGVADDADQCADTPAGASVNETGCENDADGDGVVDRLDQCPDTPAGTTVDEKGCPPAAAPPAEGCRAPAPGEPIDLEGCATGEAVVLKGVNFEVNSSRLTANAKVILNQVADSLAAASGMRVEIGGHTDAQGSDAFNQKLSERRAQAVKDYLISRGIDAARLESKGYGEAQPVDSNETVEGRELNRRVEMKILEGSTAS
jgi:OOP family OmpA-OmpF porin